jgi:hypothetical protein
MQLSLVSLYILLPHPILSEKIVSSLLFSLSLALYKMHVAFAVVITLLVGIVLTFLLVERSMLFTMCSFSNANRYDACGVCGGTNSTCWDCKKVPNGPNRYDACGVCGGNNSTCWDCKKIPNGANRYDACGVCGGNNVTCWDCLQVPNGPNRFDACGVCAGDNSTCWDCKLVPNGPNRYDACGVCGGNNSTCWDCAHTPNGGLVYDRFGICGGNGLAGCDDVPGSPTVYDLCGVCGGDNSTCTCLEYLGCSLCEVDYALLRWSLGASLLKINDTLDILYAIKHELPYYDYKRQVLDVVDYIDTLHGFADNCLDHFDFAQYWFADFLAGHCNEDGNIESSQKVFNCFKRN